MTLLIDSTFCKQTFFERRKQLRPTLEEREAKEEGEEKMIERKRERESSNLQLLGVSLNFRIDLVTNRSQNLYSGAARLQIGDQKLFVTLQLIGCRL